MVSVRRYDWILHLSAVALCSYFVAQAVTTYIAGLLESMPPSIAIRQEGKASSPAEEGKLIPTLEDYQGVVERNIFNSAETGAVEGGIFEELNPDQIGALGPAVKTNLEIKLLGTLVVGDGTDRRSSATLSAGKGSGGKGGAEVYYPGDEKSFEPSTRLTKVERTRIEFVHGGRLEYVELEDFAAKKTIFASADEVHGKETPLGGGVGGSAAVASPAESSKIIVDQREIDEALQNLDKLMTEIRIVPNFKGGQAAGMKVLSIKPGSVVSRLGIKRGDILEKVNGQPLGIQQGMELFGQMKDMKSFALDVVRGGKNQTLEYEIR